MIRQNVSTSGFDLTKEVPSTSDEYNAMAPNRENPVLADAVANTLYRGVFAEFRTKVTEAIAKDMNVEWPNSGTKEKPVYMSEGKFFNQLQASSGLEESDFIAKYQDTAQAIMDACKFDPSIKVREGGDGPKVGKNDLKMATELLAKGESEAARVAGLLGSKLNRVVEADEKSLARAFGDWRRAKAAEEAARTKAELGI